MMQQCAVTWLHPVQSFSSATTYTQNSAQLRQHISSDNHPSYHMLMMLLSQIILGLKFTDSFNMNSAP